jgi:ABC-type multidrug transport system ATPase subunit
MIETISPCIGLLGPSGCGKTTLLKVLLGRHIPDEGTVAVFGRAPHSPGHQVPGGAVGFCPQEVALYADLTISETLRFHASMHQMSFSDFEERKRTLLHMLDLADDSKIVRTLSGGQQRRVSLAAALLHAPDLLVLDEPTVGLDPMLRHRIWEHLTNLARSAGTTIIVTTHYIEEAKAADRVGLMRHGRILVRCHSSFELPSSVTQLWFSIIVRSKAALTPFLINMASILWKMYFFRSAVINLGNALD